ncbi:MAG TPA: histidine kinase [Anaerolineae bacterium]|nr:histidine kinase [Anaerolineae bacterium]
MIHIGPYAFVSVPLFIVGLVSTVSLVRFRAESTATWFLVASLASLSLGMLAMSVSSGLVLWGAAFWPAQDAFAACSMAAIIGFIYHYPQRDRSLGSRLALLFGIGTAVLACAYSAWYAVQILVRQTFSLRVHPAYPLLMPLAFLVALCSALSRTLCVHKQTCQVSRPGRTRASGWRAALLHPHGQARVLRNFALGLSLGLLQGLASGLAMAGLLPTPRDVYAIGLSLLVMIVALVYAIWNQATRQPSLTVKLIGFSLVTLLAVLGAVGISSIQETAVQAEAERALEVDVVRKAVQAGDLTALPERIVAVVAVDAPRPGDGEAGGRETRLLYASDRQPDLRLLEEMRRQGAEQVAPPPIWSYTYDYPFLDSQSLRPFHLYYGSHAPGSYCQYVASPFTLDGTVYQVIISLADANRPIHRQGLIMAGVVVLSSLFILIVYPSLFQAGIIKPLHRLLQGVKEANAGNLDVSVPIAFDDEIGFLTHSFNGMIGSIKTHIAERRQKEEALRELTATLEQRIADRTRELAVLYAVSAAASQASNLEMLLAQSLGQALAALHGDAGAIYLLEGLAEAPARPRWQLMAQQGLDVMVADSLLEWLLQKAEPLLILDPSGDPRVPPDMRSLGARPLLMVPVRADGRALGALVLIRKPEEAFGAEEVALLASIADQVGIAVRSDRLRQQAAALDERQRLARDLHDSVMQSLYGLVGLVEAGQARLEAGTPDAAEAAFTRIEATARQALNEMRLFVHRLRPPELDQYGLAYALSQRLAVVEDWSGVHARLLADETLRLPPAIEAALYQIAQEALNNTLRHAQARSVTVHLRREQECVVLEIEDDGCGFDLANSRAGGMGLANMRERAEQVGGRMEVVSAVGQGTRVRVEVVGARGTRGNS